MDNALLDIVIVNWNSGEQLYRCLKSIYRLSGEINIVSTVVVVDNASCDSSMNCINSLSYPVSLISNTVNHGFAYACNQGAAICSSKYILFLNPDTELLEGALSNAICFLEDSNNNDIGILGAQLLDFDGNICSTCARFPTAGRFLCKMVGLDRLLPEYFKSHFMVEWDHQQSLDVDQVMGAFFLIRRSLFEELNGFDERFFVYFEEVDLSLRARQAGWRSHYFPSSKAFHKGGGTSEQVKATRLYYSLRSRIFYAYKNFSLSSAFCLIVASLIIEPFSRIVNCILHKSIYDSLNTIKGYIMLYSNMKNIVFKCLELGRR